MNLLYKLYIWFKSWFNFLFNKKEIIENWITIGDLNQLETASIPRKIWIYWESSEKNELVDLCINQIKELHTNFEIIVLNKKNLNNYLNLPEINVNLPEAIVADYIRLYLLKKYGGIWLDASILLNENLNWILERIKKNQTFVFYSDECTLDNNRPIIENWMIICEEKNEFISDWFEEFEKCFLSEEPKSYYFFLKDNTSVIQNIRNTEYLMCYISAAIIMKKKNYNILTLNSASHGHFYNYRYLSNGFIIALILLVLKNSSKNKTKLIKFTKETRYYNNIFLKYKLYSNRSFIGSLYNKFFLDEV